MKLTPVEQERWRGTLRIPQNGMITYEKLLAFNNYARKETQEGALSSLKIDFNVLADHPLDDSQVASLKATFSPFPPPPTDRRFKRRGVLSSSGDDWPLVVGAITNSASSIVVLRAAASAVRGLDPPSRDAVVLDFGRLSDCLALLLSLAGPRVVVDINRTQPSLVIFRIRSRLTYGPSYLRDDFDEMLRRGFLRSDHQPQWLTEDAAEMDAFFKAHHLYQLPNSPIQDVYSDFYPTPQRM